MGSLPDNFVNEFLEKNKDNLSEMRTANPLLFTAISSTLDFLSVKFGDGKPASTITVPVVPLVPPKIKLKEFKIIWNEGSLEYDGKVFTTWNEVTETFLAIYADWEEDYKTDPVKLDGTYDKVKFDIEWENGIVDKGLRVDVGNKDYNGEISVGEYLQLTKGIFSQKALKEMGDFDNYAWTDEYVQSPAVNEGEAVKTKAEIEEEIETLKESLEFLEDDEKEAVQDEIDALESLLMLEMLDGEEE